MPISQPQMQRSASPFKPFLKALKSFHNDLAAVQSRDLDLFSSNQPQDEIALQFGEDKNMMSGLVDLPGYGKLDKIHAGETFRLTKAHPERQTPDSDELNFSWSSEYEFKSATGDILVSEKLAAKEKNLPDNEWGWRPVYQKSYIIKQDQGLLADTKVSGSIQKPEGEYFRHLSKDFSFYIPVESRV